MLSSLTSTHSDAAQYIAHGFTHHPILHLPRAGAFSRSGLQCLSRWSFPLHSTASSRGPALLALLAAIVNAHKHAPCFAGMHVAAALVLPFLPHGSLQGRVLRC
jgi:hypothetical protein